jgi:hypothetical protein
MVYHAFTTRGIRIASWFFVENDHLNIIFVGNLWILVLFNE